MINTILGSKGVNSQTFVEGLRIPVTKVMAGPCVVTQIKKMDKDGYWAVQLGFSSKKAKNTSKSLQGHLKETSKDNKFSRYLQEVKLEKEPEFKVGDVVTATEIFKRGDVVAVSGISKGKGFAGVVKKHHFRGGPRTHGQSDRERAPGSIGQTTTPGRVYKGKRMAGRMGGERVTVKNLHIISVDVESGEIEISGQVPGIVGGLLTIRKIKSGSLKDLEKETVAQVVEGEAPAEESASTAATGGQEHVVQEQKQSEAPKAEEAAKE
ncbi:MAG: 50S ribosomal protein L3, large subunit ribosomal protein L3 [Microgenomates group bacterium GW2011_GWC1_41_20]|uniref:Large ribosomal subunit protein uL3 n=7 Tax=Candidatus Woeseibacteriota TaxID=1752722 RepID=A0A0G0U9T2_9BACT|nr:MAG: 50S ribosomal protein L3 [Candidatus Woesebacteria bacterium GW2011_GWB1_40_12]KKR56250.1 MAG: 50S ribosomal protein L3 [Candidatus Woesebacteria bacterium GW2011_GWF1_40_24]KKR90757.1 MAG: 50S ribosomal protein L3 [Candidatus Woesebacteria bacterium GW2011_GWD1_41_12]KKS00771.1 MAG: 50S ribosomal protein L3, large subunit ribosomal protein L3 [Microgenomates group bacterium GW2011_GWC1_41_20]KKS05790.1 MAG: 50S ribosomal protein L3 [Candidatus Woesebacteria bacterium GW2011_GWE1_41_24]